MEILKNNKNTIIYLIFLVLFIICGYFVGINHESWADEAQHWLLARDCGILELINQRLKYEGHPLLWYLILKVFIFFKLPYEKFFIIPLIFSTSLYNDCIGLLHLTFINATIFAEFPPSESTYFISLIYGNSFII